jgi:hypothetical protein
VPQQFPHFGIELRPDSERNVAANAPKLIGDRLSRKRAAKLGLTPTEIDRMASAIDRAGLCSPVRRIKK